MDKDEAVAHAISNAKAAEHLLAVDEAQPASTPGVQVGTAQSGPYGVYQEHQAARYVAASAHAATAQAWAAIAYQLATRNEQLAQERLERQWDDSKRRSRAWDRTE